MRKFLLTIALGIISFLLISCSDKPEKYVEKCTDDKFISFLEIKIEVRESDLKKPLKEIIWTCTNWENISFPFICPYAHDAEKPFTIFSISWKFSLSIS